MPIPFSFGHVFAINRVQRVTSRTASARRIALTLAEASGIKVRELFSRSFETQGVNMHSQSVLNIKELTALIRIGKTQIYNLMRQGTFPKQLKLGKKSSRWLRIEIDHWLEERAKDRQVRT